MDCQPEPRQLVPGQLVQLPSSSYANAQAQHIHRVTHCTAHGDVKITNSEKRLQTDRPHPAPAAALPMPFLLHVLK